MVDPNKLLDALDSSKLWILLAVVGGLGFVGAVVHRFTTDPPPSTAASWKECVAGAVAALAILYVTNPSSPVALIGGSLVAGYAGRAVLDALQARVTAVLAQREAADAKRDLRQLTDVVGQLPNDNADLQVGHAKSLAIELRAKRDLP